MIKITSLIIFYLASRTFQRRLSEPVDCVSLTADLNQEFGVEYECSRPPKILGTGAFGTVFLVHRKSDQEPFALKMQVISGTTEEQSKEMVAAADLEFSVLEKLRHPNVIKVFQRLSYTNGIVSVLEFAGPTTLFDDLNRRFKTRYGVRHPRQVLGLFKQIVAGVHHVHQQGFVHRDIKPENVGLKDGVARVFDLGLVAPIGVAAPKAGTSSYIDPLAEQLAEEGKELVWTAASDVYSLGILLYQLTFKRLPYTSTNRALKQWTFALTHDYVTIDKGTELVVAELISKMILIDPQQRIELPEVLQRIHEFEAAGTITPLQQLSFTNQASLRIRPEDILTGEIEKSEVIDEECWITGSEDTSTSVQGPSNRPAVSRQSESQATLAKKRRMYV